MTDKFESHSGGLTAPVSHAVAVTPNDGADLAITARALYVGTAGDLKVTLKGDSLPVVLAAVPAGWHPVRAARVWATGTTAANIVAGW